MICLLLFLSTGCTVLSQQLGAEDYRLGTLSDDTESLSDKQLNSLRAALSKALPVEKEGVSAEIGVAITDWDHGSLGMRIAFGMGIGDAHFTAKVTAVRADGKSVETEISRSAMENKAWDDALDLHDAMADDLVVQVRRWAKRISAKPNK